MKRILHSKVCILVLVAVMVTAFAGCAPTVPVEEEAETFKIGILGPMSGPAVAWGLPAKHGAEIWVEDITAAGGIKVNGVTYMPELVVYDDENISSKAMLGARKLVLEDEVDIIMALGGDCALAVTPFLTEHKMVEHSFISTDVHTEGPYLCIPIESCAFFTGALEWIAKAYPEAKTMAHCTQDDLIGVEGTVYTEAGAEAEGIELVYNKFFALETVDFAPIVSAMLATNPDIINIGCSYVEYVDLIVEQCYHQGFEGIFVTVEFMDSTIAKVPEDWLEARKAVGCFPRFDDPVIKDRRIAERSFKEFYDEFVERWPGEWGAVSYEWAAGLDVWRHGIGLAGTIEPVAVLEALKAEETTPHCFGPGKWMGKDYAGQDNLLMSDWHWTEFRDGKNSIVYTTSFVDWYADHGDIYKKYYKKYKLGLWAE